MASFQSLLEPVAFSVGDQDVSIMGYPVQKGRSHFFITELSSGYNWVTGKEGLAMRGYCPTCNSTEELAIINKKETYPVKGEKITIDVRVAVCKACGTEVFVGEIEFENLENAYRIYRDRHGIVPAEEIRSLRKKTGLSQREFAKRLGWSPATVNRYENGALPSPAHNTVLKWLMEPEGFREIMGEAEGEKREELNLAEVWIEKLASIGPSIETGFKRFMAEKLFNMLVFFTIDNPLSKTALMKHLWFSDFRCFRETSTSISGALYAALPHGPALHKWEVLLGIAQDRGFVNIEVEYLGEFEVEMVRAAREFDGSVFTPTEIEIMGEVKSEFQGLSARELSEISHKEEAWKKTPVGAIISYEYALQMH